MTLSIGRKGENEDLTPDSRLCGELFARAAQSHKRGQVSKNRPLLPVAGVKMKT
jgi:hypothetical protein